MINVELSEQKEPSSLNLHYPVMMESRTSENTVIVLFLDVNSGIALEHPYYDVGYYANNWSRADDPVYWNQYRGVVTLSNE